MPLIECSISTNNCFDISERKKRGPTSIKEPPARPPPIVNNNNNSSKLIDEPVALRNPSNISKNMRN